MLRLLSYGSLGAAIAYFFDRDNGRRRRAQLRDRVPAFFRRRATAAQRVGQGVQSQVYGAGQKLQHRKEDPKPQPDDVTLVRKVETEIFRSSDVPKGQINVNAENGVVYLRGEVERPELIGDLVDKARRVQGVVDVESLLHLPGAAAPTKR